MSSLGANVVVRLIPAIWSLRVRSTKRSFGLTEVRRFWGPMAAGLHVCRRT